MSYDEKCKEFVDAFMVVANYNGYVDNIKLIRKYIIKENRKHELDIQSSPFSRIVSYPHNRKDILCNNPDNLDRVLWSCLVVMFGDYGTSPRFGWIVDIDECIEFLDKMIERFDEMN